MTPSTATAPRRPSEAASICPEATPEQFATLTYNLLAADPLSPKTFRHRGSPTSEDINGHSKKWLYRQLVEDNPEFFEKLSEAWNKDRWHHWTISQRTYIRQGQKLRPIDVSSVVRRLMSAWVGHHLQDLVDLEGALDPSVIAYRHASEFPAYRSRRDGITIQDVYASECFRLIRDHGPWVTQVDLRDAFGNLPHWAIHEALKELGINHRDRRIILELVRVRTLRPDGRVLKPKEFGIEQGAYLAPLIFNLVASLLARQLRNLGIESASYGDDVVLVANTQRGAERAFEIYKDLTTKLGFQNVRPIGTEGKATRIIDTTVERVPIIKTFLLCRGQIGLAEDKGTELLSRLPKNPSLNKVRRVNKWKAVSKSFIRTLLSASGSGLEDRTRGWMRPRAETTMGPAAPGSLAPPSPLREADGAPSSPERTARGQDDQGVPSEDTPLMGTRVEGEVGKGHDSLSSPMLPTPPPDRERQHPYVGRSPVGLVSTARPGTAAGTSTRANGRVPAPCGGPGAGVTSGDNDGERVGYRLSPSNSVLVGIREKELEALQEGRRLRAGTHYRQHPDTVLDVRGLASAVPVERLSHSLRQLIRVSSVRGRTRLLAHPGSKAFEALREEVGFRLMDLVETPDGMVVSVSRLPAPTSNLKKPRKVDLPTGVDTVVLGARRSRTDARLMVVTLLVGRKSERQRIRTSTPNQMLGRVEAIAAALEKVGGRTGAIPTRLINPGLLEPECRIRQVALADATDVLRKWSWTAQGEWLAGELRE